jgi:hypothetical protein
MRQFSQFVSSFFLKFLQYTVSALSGNLLNYNIFCNNLLQKLNFHENFCERVKSFVPTLKSPYSRSSLHGVPIQMSIRNKRGLALREIVPQALFFFFFFGGHGGGGEVR